MGEVYQEGCLETRISQKEKKGMSEIINNHDNNNDDDDDRSANWSAGVDTSVNADDGVSDILCCDVPGLCQAMCYKQG